MKANEHLFQVVEYRRNRTEKWTMVMTDEEMTSYLKASMEMNGYVSGLGGDKNYSIVAWYMGY